MTENTNDQPTLAVATGLSNATITATKIGKVIPDAYRLVRFRTEEGQIHLAAGILHLDARLVTTRGRMA